MGQRQRNQQSPDPRPGSRRAEEDARGHRDTTAQEDQQESGQDERDPGEGRDRAPSKPNRSKNTPWLGGG